MSEDKMKKSGGFIQRQILTAIVVGVLVIPQLSLAAWWNPFTWKIFNRSQKAPAAVVATITAPISNQSIEIEKLKKEIETLRNNPAQPSKPKQQLQEKPASVKPSEQPTSVNQQKSGQTVKNNDLELVQLIAKIQQVADTYNQGIQQAEHSISVIESAIRQYAGDAFIRESGQAVIDENRNLEFLSKKLVELETDLMNKLSSYIGSNITPPTIIEEITPIAKQRDDYATQVQASNSKIHLLMGNLDLATKLANERLAQPIYTPPPVIYQQPSPPSQTTDPQIESALSTLRNALSQISDDVVAMSVIKGRSERAVRDWMQQNPSVFSYPNYITQFNSIVVSYGLYYLAIPQ